MSDRRIYVANDIDALRMENELLTYEIQFLKAKLNQEGPVYQENEAAATSTEAEQDLVLLLRKLSKPPLGWLFRMKKNFRILEEKYL